MRRSGWLVLGLSMLALACGGGGGGGGDPEEPPPPNPLFVRLGGSDLNSGASPQSALRTISRAAQIARNNYEIRVGPGVYRESVTTASTGRAPEGLRFVAEGSVVVDVTGIARGAGFSLANSSATSIDGFRILGAVDAGILIRNGSDNLQIRNCELVGNGGDGIRVQDSSNVLVFNNLVVNNGGIGIRIGGTIDGSPGAHLINNTVYGNRSRGIEIGTTQAASPAAFVANNIVQLNSRTLEAIKVETDPRSDRDYQGNFNLVFPAAYFPTAIQGRNDVTRDALFVNVAGGNYRLTTGSPAINAGNQLADSLAPLRDFLRTRTTTGITTDNGPLDIGYHYPLN